MAAIEQSYFPISELSTYHTKCTIRARITAKAAVRSFNSKSGGAPGQVFDIHLLDESQSEIRASMFGAAVDLYKDKLQQGKVYTFTGGQIKVANRQFNRCPHRYELVFDNNAQIQEVEDCAQIKSVQFEVTNLRAIQTRSLPCTVDLCGVVVNYRPILSFTSAAGKELVKREITIADDTETSMGVTLWGERAKQSDSVFDNKPIIALKGVAVKEFREGRTGSLLEAGNLIFQPDMPEAIKLQQWWSKNGTHANLTSLSLAGDGLTDLKTLQSKAVPCTVEVCGVIVSFKPIFEFKSKEGRDLQKREIVVADDTANSITIAIWGDRAQQADKLFEGNPVVSLKGVRVQEWNGGRSGSLLADGSLIFNPTTTEAQKIQTWWSQGGSTQSITAISVEGGGGGALKASKACTLGEVREIAMSIGANQVESFSVVCRLAIVQMVKQGAPQPLLYMACQEPKAGSSLPCNKRVDESGFCAACNRVGKAAPRLNLRCRFSDFSDSSWLTTFHEAAQRVIEKTAEEAKALETGAGREALETAVRRSYFQQPLQIGVRAKIDYYNGEARPNITCFDARPVQRGAHAREMLKSINQMIEQEDTTMAVAA